MASLLDRINGNALFLLSQVVKRTGRFQVSGVHHLRDAQATGRPIIFVAWHGMTMMLVGYFSSYFDLSSIVLLVPDDWRGEALTIFARRLGARPSPMNLTGDSSMATARKLSQLVRSVRQGSNCYITPDGPDGPAYVPKPGVAYIAQKSNALILPAGAFARRAYRVNRWDQYVVPYPFSRISVSFGAPMDTSMGAEDLATVTERLTDQLHRVTATATAAFFERRDHARPAGDS